VPQAAEICALDEALKAPPGKPPASVTDPCKKRLASDTLHRRSMSVLGGYAQHLDALASDGDPSASGSLQAALSGVRGPSWIDVEEGDEKATRDAVYRLTDRLGKSTEDDELEQVVKDVAPHVKTICDNLGKALEAQVARIKELRNEIPAKLALPGSRRCAMLDNRPVCMADSPGDFMFYATEFGRLASLEHQHRDAQQTLAAFCAAHRELESAAASGALEDESTGRKVLDAVRKAIPEQSGGSDGASSDAGAAGKSDAAPGKAAGGGAK
jgi:hypothetical protein